MTTTQVFVPSLEEEMLTISRVTNSDLLDTQWWRLHEDFKSRGFRLITGRHEEERMAGVLLDMDSDYVAIRLLETDEVILRHNGKNVEALPEINEVEALLLAFAEVRQELKRYLDLEAEYLLSQTKSFHPAGTRR